MADPKLIVVEIREGQVEAVNVPEGCGYEYDVLDWDLIEEEGVVCPTCGTSDFLEVEYTQGDTDFCLHCTECDTDVAWSESGPEGS